MAIQNDRIALLDSWSNVTTGNLRDNNSKIITPALATQAVTDLYDTGISSFQTVADITALNALALATDFKQFDTSYVTDIAKGDKQGVYMYIRNRATTNFAWSKISEIGESTKKITSAEATLALYISTDWSDGDLAIGYIVKISTGDVYLLVENNGSVVGDYELIGSGTMDWGDPVDAHIVPLTDATYDLGSITKGFRDLYFPAAGTDGGVFAGTKEIARFSNATTEQLIINPAADYSGTATNPNLAISDPNWGFYMSDTNNLHFSADGTNLMNYIALGIGIGTTPSSGRKLDVLQSNFAGNSQAGYFTNTQNSGVDYFTYGLFVDSEYDGTFNQTLAYGADIRGTGSGSADVDFIIGVVGRATRNDGGATSAIRGFNSVVDIFGSGAITNAEGITIQVDIEAGATTTIAEANVIKAAFDLKAAGATANEVAGLRIDDWSNIGTVPVSYGIFMDTSIDIGTTSWALYSTSVSDSRMDGRLILDVAQNFGTTTGLWFGDGSLGIYPTSLNNLSFQFGSADKFFIQNAKIISNTTGGFAMNYVAGSTTVPVWTFASDSDTGISRSAANQMSAIAGATEIMRFDGSAANPFIKLGLAVAAPAGVEGIIYANSVTNTLEYHNGTGFLPLTITLNANATAGGLSLVTQEINFRAATNAQTGYATAAHITAIEANTLKVSNVSTSLSTGTVTATTYGITSDGGANDIVLVEATTAVAGLLGANKWDEIVANTLKVSNATHTGDVTGSTALTIVANAVEGSMLNDNVISGQTDIGAAIVDADEFLISDAGSLRRTDASRLVTYIGASLGLGTSNQIPHMNTGGTGYDYSANLLFTSTELDIGLNLKVQGQAYFVMDTLVDGTIATDANNGGIHQVTLAENSTLSAPTNAQVGTHIWIVTEDGTGGWTLSLAAFTIIGPTTAINLTASKITILTAVYNGSVWLMTITQQT